MPLLSPWWLSLWIATQYPECQVVSISNSNTQREFIQNQCKSRGLLNVTPLTADMADIENFPGENILNKFDRVISIEMFEHMKNYERLLAYIATLLNPDGMLFVHLFSHREFAREFDADDPGDWMAQTFFSGGTARSITLKAYSSRVLAIIFVFVCASINL